MELLKSRHSLSLIKTAKHDSVFEEVWLLALTHHMLLSSDHALAFQVGERSHLCEDPHIDTCREEGEQWTEPAAALTALPWTQDGSHEYFVLTAQVGFLLGGSSIRCGLWFAIVG